MERPRMEALSVGKRLTVTATTALFADMGGVALPEDCTAIMLKPEDDTVDIRWEIGGAATATTLRLPQEGIFLPIQKAVGDTIQMYYNGTAYVTLLVFVSRDEG